MRRRGDREMGRGGDIEMWRTSLISALPVSVSPHLRFSPSLHLQRAFPIRPRHIHRLHFQSMPLRVFDNRERLVEAHGLIVERRGGERGQVMAFEVSTGVSNQSKAGGVRFGKTIKRKRNDRLTNFVPS